MNSQQTTLPGPKGQSGRSADRFTSELPVEINGAIGLTRNVSATGVYFETTADQAPGSRVRFVVEVLVNGEKLKMVCAGDVVRVEQKLGMLGIAVKLSSSFFTDTDNAEDPDEQADD
ncbi:PilZ domain-containing protein [Rhodoferax sp.]|uniref:PilZ domain-containing protein n=1 Tax=Rhodoferax sp. TaxID=50421 RepID=UPI00284C3CB2|nr:PilZ domain-containing protein [Rhodoferax sp.]MDR3368488.1 PilZ domain-containing protein [Rhodoferax sp.]